MATCYDKKYFAERDILIPHMALVIKNLMRKNNFQKVLDVGCGTGQFVKFLNNNHFEAIGCDSSSEAVKVAQKVNSEKIVTYGKATSLPFKSNSFDLVTAISVIEHLKKNEAVKFVQEARRVLKKNGFIFLVTPNFATPLRLFYGRKWFAFQDKTHVTYFNPKSLSTLLIKNRFKNPNIYFKVKFQNSLEREFPSFFQKFPKWSKILAIYLLFSTPLSVVRNSFWISAQKV